MSDLKFQDTPLTTVIRKGEIYLKGKDIALALGYANPHKIAEMYRQYQDEFDSEMVTREKVKVLKPETGSKNEINGLSVDALYFNRRGAWLLAMLSKAPKAKEFRKWVLDVLENHVDANKKRMLESDREQMLDYKQSLKSLQQKLLPLGDDLHAYHNLTETQVLLARHSPEQAVALESVSFSLKENVKMTIYHAIDELQDLIIGKKPIHKNPTIHHFLERVSKKTK
jgi:prophage antirepressor-like protein